MNLLCFLSFSLLFFRQPLHFIKFVHFWLSVLYKQLVCCHIFFSSPSLSHIHCYLLFCWHCLDVSAKEESVLKAFRVPPLRFAFTYSGAAFFHGHSRELQQHVCDPFSVAPFLRSLMLLPHLYRSYCIFHIGCWVAIHCPIALVFFFVFRFLRFRCKEKVNAARSVDYFSKSGFFFFFSLAPRIY